MTNKQINIICIDASHQISKLVQSIFSSIPHLVEEVDHQKDLFELTRDKFPDLILLNTAHTSMPDPSSIRKLHLIHPGLCMLIVDENLDNIDKYQNEERLHFIQTSRLAERLPVVLSEYYSNLNKQNQNGLSFQNLLQKAVTSLNHFLVILDENARIIVISKAAEQVLGISTEDVRGESFLEFLTDGEKVWKYLVELCVDRTDQIENHAVKLKAFTNEEIEQKINFECIQNDVPYYIMQAGDEKLQWGGSEANYELLEMFADSVANELLNPVNIISGRLQLLHSNLAGQEQYQKSIVALEKQVERINETMSKLLTFAHLKQDTVPQKIDLNELVRRVLIEPSIARLLEIETITLEYAVNETLTLRGAMAHFDLLVKTLIELCYHSIGTGGKIKIETGHEKKYLNKNWAKLIFTLNYSSSTFGSETTLHAYLSKNRHKLRIKSIERTIITHLIHHYKGNYKIISDSPQVEKLIILFPG